MLDLDISPIESDWDDIHALWDDMRRFAKHNPQHIFICADDPGANYQPPRIARMGWCAYDTQPCPTCNGGSPYRSTPDAPEACEQCQGTGKIPHIDEKAKVWTITISKLKNSLRHDHNNIDFRKYMQTAAGRQVLLKALIASARHLP